MKWRAFGFVAALSSLVFVTAAVELVRGIHRTDVLILSRTPWWARAVTTRGMLSVAHGNYPINWKGPHLGPLIYSSWPREPGEVLYDFWGQARRPDNDWRCWGL